MRVPRAVPACNAPSSLPAGFIKGLAVLLVFQGVGEKISVAAGLPVPGPVIGMILLLAGLSVSPALRQYVDFAARGLLSHLSLLFVPAGVGVMAVADGVKAQLLGIGVAIVVSTVLSLWVTALVTGALMARLERQRVVARGVNGAGLAQHEGTPGERDDH